MWERGGQKKICLVQGLEKEMGERSVVDFGSGNK